MIVIAVIFPLKTHASIGSKGLILEGGKTAITLQKGDKERINVRDGRTNLPLWKGVYFLSDNRSVAIIDRDSGILEATGIGTAQIYAISENGHAGVITVKVERTKKKSLWLLPLLGIFPPILFRPQKRKRYKKRLPRKWKPFY